jgi:hypothetical protein
MSSQGVSWDVLDDIQVSSLLRWGSRATGCNGFPLQQHNINIMAISCAKLGSIKITNRGRTLVKVPGPGAVGVASYPISNKFPLSFPGPVDRLVTIMLPSASY